MSNSSFDKNKLMCQLLVAEMDETATCIADMLTMVWCFTAAIAFLTRYHDDILL